MNTRLLLSLTLSFAITGLAQAAPTAPALTPVPTDDSHFPSVMVRTGDLDLGQTDGAKALLVRLHSAASTACGGQPGMPVDLAAMQDYHACVRTRLDDAVGQVRAPLVAALYRGHDEALASAGGPG
jgi:UrcA family protein